jgi:hypothetical protein
LRREINIKIPNVLSILQLLIFSHQNIADPSLPHNFTIPVCYHVGSLHAIVLPDPLTSVLLLCELHLALPVLHVVLPLARVDSAIDVPLFTEAVPLAFTEGA